MATNRQEEMSIGYLHHRIDTLSTIKNEFKSYLETNTADDLKNQSADPMHLMLLESLHNPDLKIDPKILIDFQRKGYILEMEHLRLESGTRKLHRFNVARNENEANIDRWCTKLHSEEQALNDTEKAELTSLLNKAIFETDRIITIIESITEEIEDNVAEVLDFIQKIGPVATTVLDAFECRISELQEELPPVEIHLTEKQFEDIIEKSDEHDPNEICCICQHKLGDNAIKIKICGHAGHKDCFHEYFVNGCSKPTCPICRKPCRDEYDEDKDRNM